VALGFDAIARILSEPSGSRPVGPMVFVGASPTLRLSAITRGLPDAEKKAMERSCI
jgi:hypothetical protein